MKQEALRAAQKLEEDDAAQVELGTLAPIELTRAQALVSSSEFDLTQAQGLYRQQEVILRNLLLRAGSPVFAAGFTEIVPTDRIMVPDALEQTPVTDLIAAGARAAARSRAVAAADQDRADQRRGLAATRRCRS